ncbi:flagellar hook-length control protein FliK [Anaeromicropila herbilytica]|uniref:Flagellar hook-length control protein-like C-terminal domain-containing protein n=1 Tax=Anaeromicropila herbilytica TaxID=2785025 RepID=A0A7R7EJN6_9FIRM|nr:flagellar hook-length control protein FliK [Anaeromicropila herbilytica]BCN29998.1 hypothetical protein bsdtb5_12930 [Anaeromicropila herbilytica]
MNLLNNNYDSKNNRFNSEYISNQNTKANSTTNTSSSSTSTIESPKQDSTITLQKGSTFNGTITDIRQNEVNIKLDDGSTLTAKLTNPSRLSIGEKTEFKVVYQTEQSIGIEITSNNQNGTIEPTIQKALEGANLPMNDKNQSIVKELLNNNMSVDKQSILNIIRDAYKHPDVSVDTLVVMNKYKIPLTEQNIAQFEQYKNLEHRLMSGITSISNEMPNIINDLLQSGSPAEILSFHKELANLMQEKAPVGTNNPNINSEFMPKETGNSSDSMIDSLLTKLQGNTPPSLDSMKEILFSSSRHYLNNEALTTSILSNEERNQLLNLVSSSSPSPEETTSLLNGTLPLKEALAMIDNSISSAIVEHPLSVEQHDIVQKIIENLTLQAKEQGNLSYLLTGEERTNLNNVLNNLPISEEFKKSVLDGSITNNDFMRTIQAFLESDSDLSNLSHELLKDTGYQKLIKEALESKWSLTPKSLTEEGNVEKLYRTLQDDMNNMGKLLEHTSNMKENTSYTLNQLKDNLDFMKSLNEMFTYIQLPMKLRDQNLHSDLYIYTNKKELKDKKSNISVLLHLDMEHLGPTDIHLTLTNLNVAAKFYLTNEDTKELVATNIDYLTTALSNKGYTLQSEINVRDREKDTNIVDDLLEHSAPATSIKRYSFDIRT